MRKEDGPAKKWNYKSFRAAPSACPTVPLVNSQYFRVVLNSGKWPSIALHCGPVAEYRFLLGKTAPFNQGQFPDRCCCEFVRSQYFYSQRQQVHWFYKRGRGSTQKHYTILLIIHIRYCHCVSPIGI